MENNTTHGRKVIRGNQQSYKIVKRRFLLFTLAVLLMGAIIGSVIAGITAKNKQTTSEKNEYIMQQVNHYGASEISFTLSCAFSNVSLSTSGSCVFSTMTHSLGSVAWSGILLYFSITTFPCTAEPMYA